MRLTQDGLMSMSFFFIKESESFCLFLRMNIACVFRHCFAWKNWNRLTQYFPFDHFHRYFICISLYWSLTYYCWFIIQQREWTLKDLFFSWTEINISVCYLLMSDLNEMPLSVEQLFQTEEKTVHKPFSSIYAKSSAIRFYFFFQTTFHLCFFSPWSWWISQELLRLRKDFSFTIQTATKRFYSGIPPSYTLLKSVHS